MIYMQMIHIFLMPYHICHILHKSLLDTIWCIICINEILCWLSHCHKNCITQHVSFWYFMKHAWWFLLKYYLHVCLAKSFQIYWSNNEPCAIYWPAEHCFFACCFPGAWDPRSYIKETCNWQMHQSLICFIYILSWLHVLYSDLAYKETMG